MKASQSGLSPLAQEKLASLRDFYNASSRKRGTGTKGYKHLLAHYYNLMIPRVASVLEVGCGEGELLGMIHARRKVGVDLSARCIEVARGRNRGCEFLVQNGECLNLNEKFDVIILSETINQATDVQLLFSHLLSVTHPKTRLLINFFNNLWHPLTILGTAVGIRGAHPPENWLSCSDVLRLLDLSGWRVVTKTNRILLPLMIPVVAVLLNRGLAPLLPPFCMTVFCTARPRLPCLPPQQPMRVSVIIPARNEAGNIEEVVLRTPSMGSGTELILIEGHSRDQTWEEMLLVAAKYPEKNISLLRQHGDGKGNAVREGISAATGEIIIILDADLTVQPEELPKFYDAIASGRVEVANGVRLVYPLERESMRFLNLCANKVFGLIFSWMLGQPIKDTLCGTKAFLRSDYDRISSGRGYFGNFDPFGDFDILFGAAKIGLQITDIPIRYCERTYGSTNIRRWRHGCLLIRMVFVAARRLTFI